MPVSVVLLLFIPGVEVPTVVEKEFSKCHAITLPTFFLSDSHRLVCVSAAVRVGCCGCVAWMSVYAPL